MQDTQKLKQVKVQVTAQKVTPLQLKVPVIFYSATFIK